MSTIPGSDILVFRNVKAYLSGAAGGGALAVAAVVLDLRENAIPEMSMMLDPCHAGDEESAVDAISPSLGMLKEQSDLLQELVTDLTSKISLKLDVVDANGTTAQSLDLKDWLATGAGISGLSAAGGFTLTVQAQHPIAIGDKACGTVGNVIIDWKPNVPAANIVDMYTGVLQAWADLNRKTPGDGGEPTCMKDLTGSAGNQIAMLSKARDLMKASATAMATNLKYAANWPGNEGTGYLTKPYASCLGTVPNDAWINTVCAYAQATEEASPWEVFARYLGGDCQLTIIPTYWDDALTVVPYSPWSNPSITLYDDQISDINFPPADPAPLIGAKASYNGPMHALTSESSMLSKGPQITQQTNEILYLPPDTAAGKRAGRMLSVGLPSFVHNLQHNLAALQDSSKKSQPDTAMAGYIDTEQPPVSSGPPPEFNLNVQLGTIARTVHQAFLGGYRAGTELTFTTALALQTEGSLWADKRVTPGCCVRLRSRSDDTVLLDFYLTRVVHTISVPAKTASTSWYGSFTRPEGGVEGMVMNGTYNPIYT